jgi:hypothetical protein
LNKTIWFHPYDNSFDYGNGDIIRKERW